MSNVYGTCNKDGHTIKDGECVTCKEPDYAEITRATLDYVEWKNKKKKDDTRAILEERGARYGEFKNHAKCSQAMKDAFVEGYRGQDMQPYMWESINMILHKLARIANGDPYYDDSWKDIAGYAQLVVDELHKKDLE